MAYDGWQSELGAKVDAVVRQLTDKPPEYAGSDFASKLARFQSSMRLASNYYHKNALEAMIRAVTDGGDSPSGPPYANAFQDGTSSVSSALAAAGDFSDPPLAVLVVRELALKDARVFWGGLGGIDPGGARDKLIGYVATLKAKIEELDKHFDTLSRAARDAIAQETDLSRRMTQTLADAVGSGASVFSRLANMIDEKLPALKDPAKWMRKTAADILYSVLSATGWSENPEMWKDFADKMSKPGAGYFKTGKEVGIPAGELARAAPFLQRDLGMYVSDKFQDVLKNTLPEGTGLVIQAIGTMADQIETVASNYRGFRDAFLSTLPNHGTVLVLMSDTRRKVDEFINTNGVATARATFETARDALDAWRSADMSDGMKRDAADFAGYATAALQTRLNDAQAMFDKFVNSNSNMFVGSVSGPAEKAVFDPQGVMDERYRIRSLGLDEKLLAWRQQAITIDPKLDDYQAGVMDAISLMPDDVQDAMRDQTIAAFAPIHAALAQANAKLAGALDKMQGVAGDAQVERDLDLKPLREQLK